MKNRLPFAPPSRRLAAVAAFCLASFAAPAQIPLPSPPTDAAQAQPAPPTPKANPEENQWLAKTSKLYYSSDKAGLTGFDCAVHLDWPKLFASASKGQPVADEAARIALLDSVKITMHARMKGGSTIDWVAAENPDKPLDQTSAQLLDGMHRSVEQTLEGFLQFWSPFMEDAVVPDSADGLEITHTPTVHTIHAAQADTDLTEIFSSDLVLEQFNVVLNGTAIKFSPAYSPSAQGLLVNGFRAHILPAGTPSSQAQDMKIDVDYQTVSGLLIPDHLTMDIVGTGLFNYTFDGCTVNTKQN
jgi:hypothetical protein